MRRIPFLLLAALLLAAPAAAQQPRGFTIEEVEELLRNQVASDRVLVLAQQRCIHFVPDDAAVARVVAAGGSEELVAGLRAPGQCRTLKVADAPKPAPAQEGKAESGVGFVTLSYMQSTFRPRGTTEDNPARGGMLEFGGAGRFVGFFLRLEIVDVDTNGGQDISRGAYAGGVRLFPFPHHWPVRPYADAGVIYSEISYFNDQDETERADQGWSTELGGGVLLRLLPEVSLDVARRRRRGSFTTESWGEGEPPPGYSFTPFRGSGQVWVVGLSYSR